MSLSSDHDKIGNFLVVHSRLVRLKSGSINEEKEKSDVIMQIAEKCVPKQYVPILKREVKEEFVQTDNADTAKRRCVEKRDPAEISVSEPKPTPSLDDVIACLSKSTETAGVGGMLTQESANLIGGCTRLILRNIIQNAKKTANRENRKRITPSDVDIAVGITKIDYDMVCPLLKPTPYTDRMFWGRKLTKKNKKIDANSQELVANERFCDTVVIKDHWLVVDGVQPCVPENVVPSEVKQKYQERQQETQRLHGFGTAGVKKDTPPEKRLSSQTFSVEHQVLYSEVTKILTSGSALKRQRVLECVQTDTGIQFLAGRFVILIAEGVRIHIGARNVRGLANLLKLTWCLMKNPNIRLEKYLYVLVPSLISCVVSKSMVPIIDASKASGLKAKATVPPGQPELTDEDRERIIRDLDFEFRLRETAGRLLVELSEQYQSQNLNVRIIQILRKVLSGNQDPVAIYGVLCTFFAFGNLTIESVVVPKMHDMFCCLRAAREDVVAVKTTMTRLRKMIVESEGNRMETVQNRTVDLIMKIIYENEIYNDRKVADRDAYVALYAEFGALFYDYALNTGMIHETTGHLKVTRPSLLQSRKSFWEELEKLKARKPAPVSSQNSQLDDESMLDNILDDSNRPWTAPAAQLAESEAPVLMAPERDTFFRQPKLFVVRKERRADGTQSASYIRPLEYGHMPTLPTTRATKRHVIDDAMMYASRTSGVTTNDSADSTLLLRRFVERPDEHSAAIVYGRNMLMSAGGVKSLDAEIARAAARLSGVRLANAVVTSRSVVVHKSSEMSRGKFLSRPQTLNTV